MQPSNNAVLAWTTPAGLRAQVQKLWERGELLASLVSGQSPFPKRFPLKTPTSNDISERFDDVRAWIQELQTIPHCRIEMREFKHRLFGTNVLPHGVWIETVQDALALTGNQREASRFMVLVESARKQQPELLGWLAKFPFSALEIFDEWSRLLAVVAWLKAHPRPAVYLRQVDIPGIHSKFLEAHRRVLSELLDIVLPPHAIDTSVSGVTQFARRYGFIEKPTRIRFRILDPRCTLLAAGVGQDITLDTESFSCLNTMAARVFITENEINFLAFPRIDASLIIFGAGYGFDALPKAEWLCRCRVYYWGDIDTHGFAILNQLRSHFADVQSFLMDRATLMKFESQWGIEEKQTVRDLTRLDENEESLYNDLRDNRIRKNLRLEQERIGFRWVEATLHRLLDGSI